MSNKKTMTLMQNLLKSDLPLFPSGSYTRPAPAHIFNKFSFELLGNGELSTSVIAMRRDISKLNEYFSEHTSREIKEEFLRSIDILLNSDKRSFIKGNFSSFFLISKELINKSDPSDDGYGRALKGIFSTDQLLFIQNFLVNLLDARLSEDVVSKFISKLNEISTITHNNELPNLETKGTVFGNVIFEVFKNGLVKMEKDIKNVERINSLQKISIFLAFTVVIGSLYECCLVNIEKTKNVKPHDVLGIFCYTGLPPGNPRSVLTKLAQASLKDAISRGYLGSFQIFKNIFKENINQIENEVLKRMSGQSARDLVQLLERNWKKQSLEEFKELVSPADFSAAFRSLSGKIGFAGPVKGTGEKRILFEANFLEVLVYFFSNEGDTFEDFVNNCYERMGLILGRPKNLSESNYLKLEKLSSRHSDVDEALENSQELLRQRLVKSGLAREFSDGFTVMVQN